MGWFGGPRDDCTEGLNFRSRPPPKGTTLGSRPPPKGTTLGPRMEMGTRTEPARSTSHCQPKTRGASPPDPRRLSMPPLETCKIHSATRSHQAPTPEFSGTTAHAQTRTHTDSYALLLWIADSTCQTGAMAPFRSTPRSACASTHPRSRRSSPPPPSQLHLDSNQAGGRRHGGATPPR